MRGHHHRSCLCRSDSQSRLPSMSCFHLFVSPQPSDLVKKKVKWRAAEVAVYSWFILKHYLPTTFNDRPTLTGLLLILLLNVMMYFPASLCITWCIFKEQLWCLSPIYWNLGVASFKSVEKTIRPLDWRGLMWPHVILFTLTLAGW